MILADKAVSKAYVSTLVQQIMRKLQGYSSICRYFNWYEAEEYIDLAYDKLMEVAAIGSNESVPDESHMPLFPVKLDEIGQRLRLAREAWGFETQEICMAMHISYDSYSQWEAGKKLIGVVAAMQFAKHCRVTLDWLYMGEPASFSLLRNVHPTFIKKRAVVAKKGCRS